MRRAGADGGCVLALIINSRPAHPQLPVRPARVHGTRRLSVEQQRVALVREFEERAGIAVDPTIRLQELLPLVIQHDVPDMLDSLYVAAVNLQPIVLDMRDIVHRATEVGSVGVAVRAACYYPSSLRKVLQHFGAAAQEPLRDSIDRRNDGQEETRPTMLIQAYFNAYAESFDDICRWVGEGRISLSES